MLPDLSVSSIRKVLGWAVRLSWYNYICYHISGSDNIWADMIGRWNAPLMLRRLIYIPTLPSASNADFDWPSTEEVSKLQKDFNRSEPPGLQMNMKKGLLCDERNSIWIPDEANDLQLRLCIVAHTSSAGHRGIQDTKKALHSSFFWSTMQDDIKQFIKYCIHCLLTTRGNQEPRPYGPSFYGTESNDVLQFDYLELLPNNKGEKYILVLRDDFSSYVWLFPFAEATAEKSAETILEWCTTFNIPRALMSDGGSHFTNDTM